MFDYRFDNSMQGYCYHGAPRLAIRQGDLKLLTNVDPRFPRTELYNLSSSTFEANDLSADPALAATVSKMRAAHAHIWSHWNQNGPSIKIDRSRRRNNEFRLFESASTSDSIFKHMRTGFSLSKAYPIFWELWVFFHQSKKRFV